jgi:hypothetical protein
MRSRVVVGLAVVAAVSLSCSDGPSSTSLTLRGTSANVELNTVEGLIEALFPKGNETAALQRWAATTDAMAKGNAKVANRHMTQLADFVLKAEAQGRLDDPDGPMTTREGVLKLISLMFGAVNPGVTPPPTNLSGDFVVAVVDGSRQTVVTPTHFAGVEFPAGAAAEPFILVVKETFSERFLEPCTGPLDTTLCQYPRFYSFDPYPHVRLTRQATFGVCVVVEGPRKPSKEIDDRLRLAHDAPDDAPRKGYEHVDNTDNGENGIEILPYVQTRFLDCHRKQPEIIGLLEKLLLPRKAYAIDMGGGGQSDAFSNFNVVDPQSGPSNDGPVIGVAPGKPKPTIPPRDK